jgi:DNA-binding winged helix-turn-helix (wHTH) protein/TolB-like protein
MVVGRWSWKDMSSGRFHFGLFEFDAASHELRREGVLVRLQSQPAQVLAILLERADQVVSRDDLRKAVWGEETFVDFEGGLNFCISQIRSALRDDPVQAIYVRTVPKKGYQFIAPLRHVSAPQGRAVDVPRKSFVTHKGARAAALAAAVIFVLAAFTYRFRSVQSAISVPILAVVHFDDENSDPRFAQFCDALTDNVVEQLTSRSKGNFRVIGNAQILRMGRDQRDLKAIASSLHAAYVVLGQVQSNGAEVRILAHLIRAADQTHIWVVRIDGPLADPLSLESEAAGKIATEFAARMSGDPDRAPSFPLASH